MLALEAGWTPDVLAQLPQAFRAACHWVIYSRALAGPEGFPNTDVPLHAPPEAKMAALKVRQTVDQHRALLFPPGDD
jgi:hypothetical protein